METSNKGDANWAKSLVGKDWEIFWDDDEGDENNDGDDTVDPSGSNKQSSNTKQHGDKSSESESEDGEGDVTDWYDARVVSMKQPSRNSGGDSFTFQVRFVGEDALYTMPLDPSLVRPSARAWLTRTKAILCAEKMAKSTMKRWENQLPPCTGTPEDDEELQNLESSICTLTKGQASMKGLHTSLDEIKYPPSEDIVDVQRFKFLVRSQIYLRSKLAPISQCVTGTRQNSNNNENNDEPSDSYCDYLVKCLEKVGEACTWYESVWTLHRNVFMNQATTDVGQQQRNLEMEGVCQSVQKGVEQILAVSILDISQAGHAAAASAAAAHGRRRTKRRRAQRDIWGSTIDGNDGSSEDEITLEEGKFVTLQKLKRLIRKTNNSKQKETPRWFLKPFLETLMSLFYNIQEPVRVWRFKTEVILGKRTHFEDDEEEAPLLDLLSEQTTSPAEDDDMGDDESRDVSSISSLSTDNQVRKFNFAQINGHLKSVSTHPVLARFNLETWKALLREKIEKIESFEKKTWDLLSRLVHEPETTDKSVDPVLTGLKELLVLTKAKEDALFNVDPIGTSESARVNANVVEDAIATREWILDLVHAEKTRERVSFVQSVVSRAPNLPHIPEPPSMDGPSIAEQLARVTSRVQAVSAKLYSHVHVITQYERMVAESLSSTQGRSKLGAVDQIEKVLKSLEGIPVLSVVEEKLLVRIDLILWIESCQSLLADHKDAGKYELLTQSCKDLEVIKSGQSKRRSEAVIGLVRNDGVEKQIRAFAAADFDLLTGPQDRCVVQLFSKSTHWKERANAILETLKHHGNPMAEKSLSTSQRPSSAMIDLKRIQDLLAEYKEMNVEFLDQHRMLQSICDSATTWSRTVYEIIEKGTDLLPKLTELKAHRPKGVLMEPARAHMDLVFELLEWHGAVKACCASDPTTSYSLLLEGIELMHLFADNVGFTFNPEELVDCVSAFVPQVRQVKPISQTKLAVIPLGLEVLNLITASDYDKREGGPLNSLLFLCWSLLVARMASNLREQKYGKKPTMEQALSLLELEPALSPDSLINKAVSQDMSTEIDSLKSAIEKAKQTESEARELASMTKDSLRGSFNRAEEIKQLLQNTKRVQLELKGKGSGLVLSNNLEKPLDQIAKDLGWLVKTLNFPDLHTSDPSFVSDPARRIPWDILVSLHERIQQVDLTRANLGDIPAIALRVKELYEAGNCWQHEVSRVMNISIRGTKRRGAAMADTGQNVEILAKVSTSTMAHLAQSPVLKKVLMPREASVKAVLEKAQQFEQLLHSLLAVDFEGIAADNAPYPEAGSMIGDKGEFLLYRLTGSPLFEAFGETIDKLAQMSTEVLADTPGKEAFEWLQQILHWIESVRDMVTHDNIFDGLKRLVLRATHARQILQRGTHLLLDISDDVRKSLSNHGIIVSTNRQTERLTALIAKAGAHHSPGGTVIKWCPLIIEWLKEDTQQFEKWTMRGHSVQQAMSQTVSEIRARQTASRNDIQAVYNSCEEIQTLLIEGRDLFVTPEKDVVARLVLTRENLLGWVKEVTSAPGSVVAMGDLMKQRYTDGASIMKDRSTLLDSLLARKELMMSSGRKKTFSYPADGSSVRDKARTMLEGELKKVTTGMKGTRKNIHVFFPLLKAWEIENSAYAKHPLDRDREGYRDKIKSLRSHLEHVKNPTLGAQVLSGEISVDKLVELSPKDFAGMFARLRKGKRKQPEIATAGQQGFSADKVNSPRTAKRLKFTGNSSKIPALDGGNKTPTNATTPHPGSPNPSTTFVSGSETQKKMPPPLPASSTESLARKKPALTTAPSLALAASSSSTAAIASSPASREGKVLSKEGTDRFTIIITKPIKLSFRAELISDEASNPAVSGFLSATLTLKGRLGISEYSKWIAQKLSRYNTFVLRVSARQDAGIFKTFYKTFEADNRVAYFDVGRDSHLILVPPKFHKAAREIRDRFKSRGSTYAIVQTKERLWSD